MQRAIVIGAPGSGKSTFARALAQKTRLPLVHLDLLYWNSDKTSVEKPVFLSRLHQALSRPAWIIDGNYNSTLPLRLAACDTVFFLDYPTELCLAGIRERRGKLRGDMPWIETEEDPELLAFVRVFPTESRPHILALLKEHPEKTVCVFSSREEASAFLAEYKA